MFKTLIGKLDVLSVFIAWSLLIIFFLALGYGKFLSPPEANASHLVYIFGGGLVLLYFILSWHFLIVALTAISV